MAGRLQGRNLTVEGSVRRKAAKLIEARKQSRSDCCRGTGKDPHREPHSARPDLHDLLRNTQYVLH